MTTGPGGNREGGENLQTASAMWPSPQARDHNDGEQPETFEARRARLQEKHQNGNGAGTPLTMAVKMWGTPTTRDHKDGASDLTNVPENGLLGRQASNWATERGNGNLEDQTAAFSLPAPETTTRGQPRSDTLLNSYLRLRATTDSELRSEMRTLLRWSIRARGKRGWTRKAPTVYVRPSFRKSLNPRFASEWLMGWPLGWSELALRWDELIGSVSAETGSFLRLPPLPSARSFADWQHEMRTAISRIDCGTSLPTQQLSMFG